MRNADCVERPRKVSRMCYQGVVRHNASKICDHAICSENGNFPTCCRLEYLAFLDDPEEPVDKGLILLSIFRLLTLLYVTQRHITSENEHISCFSQPPHTIDLFTSRFILSFEFHRSNLKEKNEESILFPQRTPYINYCDPVVVRSPRGKTDHATEVYVPCSFQTDLWFYLRSV